MENEIICLDTSILIEYYRKKDKSKSTFAKLAETYHLFAVSAITEYEILVGSNPEQDEFWQQLFGEMTILPYTRVTNTTAIRIYRDLKPKGKIIDVPDLLIGATALSHGLKMATLNKRHFERIEGLEIIKI